tara:strand:+ start:107 stop:577 length:471 start_codon:yes stop_codon:yes gene_type:complete
MSTHYKPSYSLEVLKQASKKKFGIVSSEWNTEIIKRLLNGAYDFFSKIDINEKSIQHYSVPGSFELISGCVKMQSDHNLDAIIAIGSIIQGETKHFDFISQSVCNGIKDLNIVGNCPIILCLLTDNDYQQALDRSGGKHGNKGYDSAEAAAKMTLI